MVEKRVEVLYLSSGHVLCMMRGEALGLENEWMRR